MIILVTGATGFSGKYLIDSLTSGINSENGVYGTYFKSIPVVNPNCQYIKLNLSRVNDTIKFIKKLKPDIVIHLAGSNSGTFSELFSTNVITTQNLLSALRDHAPVAKILIVGSSAEYGFPGFHPIDELAPLNPVSPYGISKVASSLLALSYFRQFNSHIVVVRPFNLVGPLQSKKFVCGKIVAQIKEIEGKRKNKIELGNLNSKRDFIDVRDVIEAYKSLIFHKNFGSECEGHIFNVGSNRAVAISDVLECCGKIMGKCYVVDCKEEFHADLIPSQISDNSKITKTTGWKPRLSLEESLRTMLTASALIR
jgi:GDP-4-dehydro-6-deoxy-D-mannose reductase